MLECDVLDMKDDYDFKDKTSYFDNKQNERKKIKNDVSFINQIVFSSFCY